MKLFKVLYIKTIAFNILMLILFSSIITFISLKLPDRFYYYKTWLYHCRKWEKGGEFYSKVLKVNIWKSHIPELSDFIKSVFPKKHIKVYNKEYLLLYLKESCKAELTHWGIILCSLLFILWNDFFGSVAMIALTSIINLPFIVIQRYNRPRIIHILDQIEY
jgi:hypothetical protein